MASQAQVVAKDTTREAVENHGQGWATDRHAVIVCDDEVDRRVIDLDQLQDSVDEAGVAVGKVNYVGSQPWPFPSSLMIGCYAEALDDALTIDRTELEEADWFTRDEVAAAMRGEEDARFIAPPPQAIAHHLLKWWLER